MGEVVIFFWICHGHGIYELTVAVVSYARPLFEVNRNRFPWKSATTLHTSIHETMVFFHGSVFLGSTELYIFGIY